MKYSILVPVYNVEKYLEQCLDSLANQTFQDYEVILADDGSTDSSGAICDRYAASYPDIFRVFHKPNEGLLMTRRFSLRQAKGEYILFVDSDDYVSEDLLRTVDAAFTQYRCDMVLYNFCRFCDGREDFTPQQIPYPHGTVFEGESKHALYRQFVLQNTFCNMWIKAVKRDCIDIDGDYSQKNVAKCEDVIQSLPLLNSCSRIVYIDRKLYFYRKNPGSMTLNCKDRDFEDYTKAACEVRNYLDLWEFSPNEKAQYYANRLYFYYELLRNIRAVDTGRYRTLAGRLLQDHFLKTMFLRANIAMLPMRVRFTVMLFRHFAVRNRLVGVHAVIWFSNIAKGVRAFVRKQHKA